MTICEEADQLHQEALRLHAEHSGLDHEFRMTPKSDRYYAEKKRELKKAAGRLHEAWRRLENHAKEHGCRPWQR